MHTYALVETLGRAGSPKLEGEKATTTTTNGTLSANNLEAYNHSFVNLIT